MCQQAQLQFCQWSNDVSQFQNISFMLQHLDDYNLCSNLAVFLGCIVQQAVLIQITWCTAHQYIVGYVIMSHWLHHFKMFGVLVNLFSIFLFACCHLILQQDSNICAAAIHAGVVLNENGGDCTLLKAPGQNFYPGSTRNGIISRQWVHKFYSLTLRKVLMRPGS